MPNSRSALASAMIAIMPNDTEATWAEPVTILADPVLEVRIRQGQVHILRKPPVEDDEDREFRATNAPYLGDDV